MFLTVALGLAALAVAGIGAWLVWSRHQLWLEVERLEDEVTALTVENASVVSDRNNLAEELAFTEPWPLWTARETHT
jgi:hypothetical protein